MQQAAMIMPSHPLTHSPPRPLSEKPWRPTKTQLEAAKNCTLPDLIAPNLEVLFAGINPGLYTAAIQHHFGRPGNRFWPTLHAAGFTDRVLSPFDERELLPLGYGITNVVARATASADELTRDEFIGGGKKLIAKVKKYRPKVLAVVGVGAYRHAFGKPRAKVGLQDETIDGTRIWVLPNPSGLNANYQAAALADAFAALRGYVEQ